VLGPQPVVQLVPNFPTTFLEQKQIKSTVLNRIEAFCDFSEDGVESSFHHLHKGPLTTSLGST